MKHSQVHIIKKGSSLAFCILGCRQDLALFCRSLFGLEGISIDNLLSELDSRIGIFEKAGTVYLNWNLLYISCLKNW